MRGFEIGRRLRGTVDTVTVSTPWSPRSGRKQDAFGQLPVDGAQGFMGAPAGGRPGVAPPPNKTGARHGPLVPRRAAGRPEAGFGATGTKRTVLDDVLTKLPDECYRPSAVSARTSH